MRLMSSRSAIVITGDPIELARDLEALAVRFDLQLPDPSEIREMVRTVVESMSARQRVRVDLSKEDAQQLVRALSGLTLSQVRQAIAKVIVADNALTAEDIDRGDPVEGRDHRARRAARVLSAGRESVRARRIRAPESLARQRQTSDSLRKRAR